MTRRTLFHGCFSLGFVLQCFAVSLALLVVAVNDKQRRARVFTVCFRGTTRSHAKKAVVGDAPTVPLPP